MHVEHPDPEEVDRLADCWVDLARGQRAHGSHLAADANRARVREAVASQLAADGVLVAREGGAIVGFVTYGLAAVAFETDATRGLVHNLWVAPDRRDEGVGAALLSRAEADLAERGADVVALEVMADNDDARRFYEREGYREHRMEVEKPVGEGSSEDAEQAVENDTDSSGD